LPCTGRKLPQYWCPQKSHMTHNYITNSAHKAGSDPGGEGCLLHTRFLTQGGVDGAIHDEAYQYTSNVGFIYEKASIDRVDESIETQIQTLCGSANAMKWGTSTRRRVL